MKKHIFSKSQNISQNQHQYQTVYAQNNLIRLVRSTSKANLLTIDNNKQNGIKFNKTPPLPQKKSNASSENSQFLNDSLERTEIHDKKSNRISQFENDSFIEQHQKGVIVCENHMDKKGKYIIENDQSNKFYCSKCAIQLVSQGFKALESEEVIKKFEIQLFLIKNQKFYELHQSIYNSVKQKYDNVMKFYDNQVYKTELLFNESIKKLENLKDQHITKLKDFKQQAHEIYEKTFDIFENQQKDIAQMKSDINKNFDQIIENISLQPFKQIMSKYEEKLAEIQKESEKTKEIFIPVLRMDKGTSDLIENFLVSMKTQLNKQITYQNLPSTMIKKQVSSPFQNKIKKREIIDNYSTVDTQNQSNYEHESRDSEAAGSGCLKNYSKYQPNSTRNCQRNLTQNYQKTENSPPKLKVKMAKSISSHNKIAEKFQNNLEISQKFNKILDKIALNQQKTNRYYTDVLKRYSSEEHNKYCQNLQIIGNISQNLSQNISQNLSSVQNTQGSSMKFSNNSERNSSTYSNSQIRSQNFKNHIVNQNIQDAHFFDKNPKNSRNSQDEDTFNPQKFNQNGKENHQTLSNIFQRFPQKKQEENCQREQNQSFPSEPMDYDQQSHMTTLSLSQNSNYYISNQKLRCQEDIDVCSPNFKVSE